MTITSRQLKFVPLRNPRCSVQRYVGCMCVCVCVFEAILQPKGDMVAFVCYWSASLLQAPCQKVVRIKLRRRAFGLLY